MKHMILSILLISTLITGCGERNSDTDPCSDVTCSTWQLCDEGACILRENMCETEADCEAEKPSCNSTTHLCEVATTTCTENETKCDGNILLTCTNQEWIETDCTTSDKVCGVDEGVASCQVPTVTCTEDETKCDSDTLLTCTNQEWIETDCTTSDKVCGVDEGVASCQIPAVTCTEDETKCDGDTLLTCTNQEWIETDCTTSDKVCGVDEGVASCIATSPQCHTITVDLHTNSTYGIDLKNHTATASEVKDCDYIVAKSGAGPMIALCAGIEALDYGNTTAFLDVIEAPESGYESDSGTDYVIGTSWRDGGSGSTGFNMTQNIYIFQRKDGSYGKLEVKSATAGKIVMQIFSDPEGGSNLSCVE